MDSYFEKGVKLEGVLKAKNPVRLDGEFRGEVESQGLFVVDGSGLFVGNIQSYDLTNKGVIEGDISASNKIDLKSQSQLCGDITAYQFAIEEGAGFNGRCQMAKAPKDKLSTTPPEETISQKKKSKKKRSNDSAPSPKVKKAFKFGRRVAGVALLIGLAVLIWSGSDYFLKTSKGQVEIHLENAVVFVQAGKLPEAIKEFNRAVEIRPRDPRAYLGLAEIHIDKKRFHKARSPLKKAIKLAPKTALYHVRLADVYRAEKRWEEALDEYKTGVKLDPKNHSAFYGMSQVYEEQEKPDQVVSALQQAVKLAPEVFEFRKALGKGLIRQGKKLKGARQFQEALKIRQDDPSFIIQTGEALLELNYKQEAYRYFKQAALLLPQDFQGQIRAEDWYFEKNVLDDFIKSQTAKSVETNEVVSEKELSDPAPVEKESELNLADQPENPEILLAVGRENLAEKNYADDLDALKTAEAAAPGDPQIQLAMCNAYRKKVFYTAGIVHCQKALELKKDYYEAMNRLAWLYAKKKINLDEGIALSQRTLEKFPEKHEYIDTLSELYFAKGEAEKAVESMQVAIKLAPGKKYYQRQLERFEKK